MRRFLARLNPSSWIYLLAHLLLATAGFLMMTSDKPAYDAIGTSLVAAGITGWVVYIYFFFADEQRARLSVLSKAGLTDVQSSRGATVRSIYDDRLLRAHKQLDLLGFGQNTLREDHRGDFEKWKSRAPVRILLIDPEYPSRESSYAGQRDLEEGAAEGQIAREVEQFLRDVTEIRDERFRVRLYKCLPSVSIFRIDDEILWGPYLAKRVSRNSPTLIVEQGGTLFRSLDEHFEAIWNSDDLSREAPL